MARPLMGRRPKRKPWPPKHCLVAGCKTVIPRWQWLCKGCFHALPFASRKEIAEACQRRAAPNVLFGLCRAGAEWLVAQRAAAADR